MSFNEFRKSGKFVLLLFAAFVVAVLFLLEEIGGDLGFSFSMTKWAKGLFTSRNSGRGSKAVDKKVDWDRQLKDLKEFSDLVDGLAVAKISIVSRGAFQVVRADPNPATASRFSWELQLRSGALDVNATQVRDKLSLICAPEDKVSGKIATVKALANGKKGFLVTVENVRGKGKIGLSYEGLPPVYYDVMLRNMWLVPIASCRSAMKGRYESAVFFPGMEKGLPEGAIISPGEDKCGYRVLSVSDRCVWFEAFYGNTPPEDTLPHSVWPDFSRVDTLMTPPPGRLAFGSKPDKERYFWQGDAIKLPNTGAYLMLDDLVAGRAAVFRLLDAAMRPVCELLCVIVRER